MAKGKSTKASKLVQECLATLDVSNASFADCSNLEEEWKVIKRGMYDVFVSIDTFLDFPNHFCLPFLHFLHVLFVIFW